MSKPWKDKLKTVVSSYENVSELVFDQSVDEGPQFYGRTADTDNPMTRSRSFILSQTGTVFDPVMRRRSFTLSENPA
jgi:hypothetical protein